MATLGIVGLGLLGSAVAGRLRAGGHDVVGYDLVAEKGKALVELGGRAAPSAEAVAKSVEAVCVVLPSLASVEAVVLGPRGLAASGPAGATIIQMSTISAALTERLAREVTARDVAHARSPRPADCAGRVPAPDEARPLHEGPAPHPGGRAECRRPPPAHGRRRAALRRRDGGGIRRRGSQRGRESDRGDQADLTARSRVSRSSPRWSTACLTLSTRASRREIS